MGMPINSYTLLRALTQEGDNYENRIAKGVFNRFNLFAFVIHIPEFHDEFDKKLNEQFDFLDVMTNDRFLFFALCNPPEIWLQNAKRRGYFKYMEPYGSSFNSENNSQIITKDKMAAAVTLMHAFNLDFNHLPCLIVTNDLSSSKYLTIKTDHFCFVHQLQQLGYLTTRYEKNNLFLEIYENKQIFGEVQKREFYRGKLSNDRRTVYSVAHRISDALSFIVMGSNLDDHIKMMAKPHTEQILKKQIYGLNKLKYINNNSEEINATIVKRSLRIASYASNLTQESNNDYKFNFADFETESIYILKTLEKISSLLNSQKTAYSSVFKEDISWNSLETSPFIISYGKVFEIEIDLSIAQWIRKNLGINLPEYYNLHQPNLNVRYFPKIKNPKPIDFNSEKNGKLLLPGLGQTELAFYDFKNTFINEQNWQVKIVEDFVNSWRIIRELRNKAGHIDIMNKEKLDLIKEHMSILSVNGIFRELKILKQKLKGEIVNR